MTNKITKEFLFTELSIKIATLEMKIDRLLELAVKSSVEVHPLNFDIRNCDKITPSCLDNLDCECAENFKEFK